MHDSHQGMRHLKTSAMLVSVARGYKHVTNPVGFIARAFIKQCGLLLSDGDFVTRTCLDIGAGTAPYAQTLRQYMGVERYIALDIAPSESTSVVADCAQLPFTSASIDLIVSFDVIQHVPSPHAMLTEAHRVLRGGGHIILTYPFLYPECDVRDFHRWTVEGMHEALVAHGFEIVRARRRGGALFAWVCWVIWMIQHLVPGQRQSWRARRNLGSYLRAGVLAALTLPVELLGWIALGLDRVLPSQGMYMGACVLARKTLDTKADGAPR